MRCFRCERPLFNRPDVVVPMPHGQEPAYYGPKCAVLAGLATPGRATRAAAKAPGQKQMPLFNSRKRRAPTQKPKESVGQVDWINDLDNDNSKPPEPNL